MLLRHRIDAIVPAPNESRRLATLLIVLYACIAVALVAVPWQQTAQGAGRVVAYAPLERQQIVQAPIEGRVLRWHVIEGSRVRRGDPIVDLTDNDPEILARLRAERDALVARIDAANARAQSIESRAGSLSASRRSAMLAAESRRRMAGDRVRGAMKALEAAEAHNQVAALNLIRQEKLFSEGLSSKRQFEVAQAEGVKAHTEVERAKAALAAAERDEDALDADRLKVGTDGLAAIDDAKAARASALAEVASAKAELARIEVRLARQEAQAVTAPRDGTILRLLVPQGTAMVKAADGLAVLVPDTDERAVELWIDGNDVPLLSEGREVRLQFEGWPAVQFTGWPQIAVGTFGGIVKLIDAADDGKGKFRVLIVPDGQEPWPSGRFLRQGTRAQGWVLLSRVRLGYELWRQFNGFPPVVASDEASALKQADGKGGKSK